jgi:hypothetical protein
MNIDNKEEGITVISTENILNSVKPYLCEALRMSKNISHGKEKYIKIYINFSVYIKKEPCVLF